MNEKENERQTNQNENQHCLPRPMSRVISLQAKLNCFLHFTSKHTQHGRRSNQLVSERRKPRTAQEPERERERIERNKKNAKKKLINRQKNQIKLLRWSTQSVHFIYCIFSTLQFFLYTVWFDCAVVQTQTRIHYSLC